MPFSLLPLVPAALAALFAIWCGSFPAGATFSGAVGGQVALLVAALLGGAAWRDPLRLGRFGRFIPLGLWLTVMASDLASPVPRAGRLGMILLPAFLLVPALVERCWREAEDRRRGLAAIAVVAGAVAGWGLLDRLAFGSPRAAMPLGHHNLLAGYLVALLPLVLLSLRERGLERSLALAGGVLSLAAIAASGSLLAAVALSVQVVLLLLWRVGWHRLLLPTALLVLGLQMPRVAALVSGQDASTQARLVYLDAGWRGLKARPWLGWGPGSVPWTLARFLRPRPGINPPGEVVGDLHSLPMQILYELGGVGFVFTLGTAAFFLRRRITERGEATDPGALGAGLIGLLGAAVTRLGGASLAVTALPLTVGLAAGCALCGRPRDSGRRGTGRGLVVAYVLVAAIALWPLDAAMFHYENALAALGADSPVAASELAEAHRYDPPFPLYTARLAVETPGPAGAELARTAAVDGLAVAPLWLVAGEQGAATGQPWAEEALLEAARLDPMGALAPFHAMVRSPGAADAALLGARALLGEPRLLAARFWQSHVPLRAAAVDRVNQLAGIDAGWRQAFLAAAVPSPSAEAPSAWIGLEMDGEPYLAVSLHVFRRAPSRWTLAPIEVDEDLASRINLPPATGLATTKPEVFLPPAP